MTLSYDDLIEPTIVKQVSKSVRVLPLHADKEPAFLRWFA